MLELRVSLSPPTTVTTDIDKAVPAGTEEACLVMLERHCRYDALVSIEAITELAGTVSCREEIDTAFLCRHQPQSCIGATMQHSRQIR
jgi:hypothetical protein